MDAKKVSELTAATEVSDSDIFVMEQGGVAKKVTAAILKALFGGGEAGLSVDTTLSVEGAAADAAATGTAISTVSKAASANSTNIKNLETKVTALQAKASAVDYSDLANGNFTVTMSDGTSKAGTMTFDDNGNPTSVTLDGHTMSITFPA